MCRGNDAAALARKQRAVDVGALEALARAMQEHLQVASVQEHGCAALHTLIRGTTACRARKQRAVRAGGRVAAIAALQAHPGNADIQKYGQLLIDGLLLMRRSAGPPCDTCVHPVTG